MVAAVAVVAVIFATGVLQTDGSGGDGAQDRIASRDNGSGDVPTSGSTLNPGQTQGCDNRDTVEADVNGDEVADLVFHDFFRDLAILGVCIGNGGRDKIAGASQAELLTIIDIQGDGKDEMFFGGTTMIGEGFNVAVMRKELRAVVLRKGERLNAWHGLERQFGRSQRTVGLAFGCEDVDGDGRNELGQVVVDRRGDRFRWVRTIYRIRGSKAEIAQTRAGHVPAQDGDEQLLTTAEDLITACQVKVER